MSKKKKGTRESSPTTNVSSPIRGANQDQSGHGVSHSVADYTISDETEYEGFVAAVGPVRGTPVQMTSTPRGRKERNAPRSAAGLQRAADRRRLQLDKIAQKRKKANEEVDLTNMANKIGAKFTQKGPKMPKSKMIKSFTDFVKEDNDRPIPPDPVSNPTIRKYGKEFVSKALEPLTLVGQGAHEGDAKKVATGIAKGAARVATAAGGLPGMAAGAAIDAAADSFGKKNTNEEYMEEGRPKKNATSDDPGSEHIVMQLRKAISMRGQHPVKFVNGKSSLVSPSTAHRLLSMHDNMKTSAEKDEFAKHIHKSVDHMRDALAGKMPEKPKNKISLGGSHGNYRK